MRKAPGLILLFFLFRVSLLSGESAEQLLLAGRKAFSQKFFSSAARNFGKLTEDYPEDSRADDAEYLLCVSYFYLGNYQKCLTTLLGFKRKYQNSKYLKYIDYWQGNALFYLGRREEALELLRSQITGYPGELYFLKYSLLLEGIILEELEQGEEAIEVYLRLLQLLSDSAVADNLMPEVLYRLGGVELEHNHFFKSRSIFSRLLFDYPESSFSSNALFFLAESYYFLEDFQAAFDRYERAAAAFTGHPYGDTIIFRMSRILARRGRLEDALGYLEKLESSFPASSHLQEVEQLRGEIYFDLRDYKRAAIAYRKAIPVVRDKDELQALNYNLAMAAYQAGLKEEAVEHFAISAAGEEKKTKESALFNLGVALADLKRNNEAIENLKGFTATFPASVHLQEALTLLGNLYSLGGSAAAAEEVFTRLISYYPDSPEKYEYTFKRGNSRRVQNNNIKALKDFQVVIKHLPNSEMGRESLYNVGYIYSQKNEYRRALSYFTRILDGESEAELTNRTLLAIGFCRYNLGQYEESLADFTRLAATGDAAWNGQGFFHQGRVLYKLEKLPEAAKSFSRAAQKLSSSSGRAEAIFWQGLTEFRMNNPEAARDIFLSIPVLYPDNQRIAESFYRAGLCEAAL
nr:tetratricopeptide repeat protein [Spirochaeta sp.]